MEHLIFIREAITDSEIARFFEKLHLYHQRDIFPEIEQAEDLAYFLSDEYLSQLKTLHRRQKNRLHFLFFERGGQDIGFTMPVIYGSEDGKCFIMEFCVYPEFRGNSTGHACGKALLSWARERRASYFELNCDTAPRERFWGRRGFLPNGEGGLAESARIGVTADAAPAGGGRPHHRPSVRPRCGRLAALETRKRLSR